MEYEIEVDGEVKRYNIKRITYAEYNEILKKNMKVKYVNGIQNTEIDYIGLKNDILKASVGDIDFSKLSIVEGLKLEKVVMEVNGLSENFF